MYRYSPIHEKILKLVQRSQTTIVYRLVIEQLTRFALLFAFITKSAFFRRPPLKSLADHYPASVSISLILELGKYRVRVYSRASKQPAVSLSPPPLLIFPLSSYFRSRRSVMGRGNRGKVKREKGRKGGRAERECYWHKDDASTRVTYSGPRWL